MTQPISEPRLQIPESLSLMLHMKISTPDRQMSVVAKSNTYIHI